MADESHELDLPVTGDAEVDQIVADFVEARTEIEERAESEEGRESEERTPASNDPPVEEQDRVASTVHAAQEAHRRLQERLAADRE